MSSPRNSCFSTLFRPLSRCVTTVKNSRFPTISAGIMLVGAINILDFICTQKMTDDKVDWDYYGETPSRIVWLILKSIMLGWNVAMVITALKTDKRTDPNTLSAKEVFIGTTAYTSTMQFSQLALTKPITTRNAGYIIADTLLNGPLTGTLLSSAGYFLQKLNYTIRPITWKHAKFISAGILFSTMQELLDFVCDELIKNNSVQWSNLTSPARLLAWHTIVAVTQGVVYGITALSYKKYMCANDVTPEHKKIHNYALIAASALSPIAFFTELSLTTPLRRKNAPYIVVASFVKGIPTGLVSITNSIVLIRLGLSYHQRRNAEAATAPLLEESKESPTTSTVITTQAGDLERQTSYRKL